MSPGVFFSVPFSYKTDSVFWPPVVFSRFLKKISAKPAELYTYSRSTAVRAALLTAGFFVAEGVGTGPKPCTTIAFTKSSSVAEHPLAPALLGEDWLARWKRSRSKVPAGVRDEEKPAFEKGIET